MCVHDAAGRKTSAHVNLLIEDSPIEATRCPLSCIAEYSSLQSALWDSVVAQPSITVRASSIVEWIYHITTVTTLEVFSVFTIGLLSSGWGCNGDS